MNSEGASLLLIALIYNQWDIVRYLVKHEADVNQSDKFNISPSSLAIHFYRQGRTSRELLSLIRPLAVMASGDNTVYELHRVLVSGELEDFRHALEARPGLINSALFEDRTLLHYASSSRASEKLEFLLEKEADANLKDVYGRTPLHTAVYGGFEHNAQILIPYTDVQSADVYGYTPLCGALLNCENPLIVEMLLSAGADISAHTKPGTILDILAMRDREEDGENVSKICQLLVESATEEDSQRLLKESSLVSTVRKNNAHSFNALRQAGVEIDPSRDAHILHEAGDYATLDLIQALRAAEIEGINPDCEADGWTAMENMQFRRDCTDGELLTGSSRPAEEDIAAFVALLDEIRERNSAAAATSTRHDQRLIPGAWVD
ncbi:ankyrin repeat-containing domain protein [Xylariaceae sp. FL0016]|nr:ankyrin repeat-containing domain protein [Xylariaceae sp. FL0016]